MDEQIEICGKVTSDITRSTRDYSLSRFAINAFLVHRTKGVDDMDDTSKQLQSASCYSDDGSKFQRDSGHQFLQQLSPRRGSTALDLGCGTGYLATQLSECVGPEGKVIAVDPDEERLKIAREKYARDNIEYMNGNDATFPEGPYDLVFANQVIHWVTEKDALFGRVYQSLKSGGRFAFTTTDGSPVHAWPPVATKCVGELFGPDHLEYVFEKRLSLFTRDQYQELAVSNGFVVTSMEDKDVSSLPIGSVDVLIAFFFGLLHGELDREAIGEQTIKDCKEKYDDDLREEAERHQTTRVLHVVLTKP